MGFSLYRNPSRLIFVLEEKHGFVNTNNLSITKQLVHVLVISVYEITHPEESITVICYIFFFTKTYSLSNFLKPLLHHDFIKNRWFPEDVYLL